MRVLIVFGTRPEAIKMCPVVLEAKRQLGEGSVFTCVSGQHHEMLQQVLNVFGVRPDYDLKIMTQGQTLFDITERVLSRVKEVLISLKPDVVLVHGDTTTAFATALAAFYLHIPVGHVEAGLRTGNPQSPFPEEFNRVAIDEMATFCFAPTKWSANNLRRERIKGQRVFVTGNTVVDALAYTVKDEFQHIALEKAEGRKLVLMTCHRRENLGAPMEGIFKAINRIALEHPDIFIYYPMHPNPAIADPARRLLTAPNINIDQPLDVLAFHNLLARSYLVLSDSGGVQEEAPTFGVPVLVLRNTTERPEGVEAGTLLLAGNTFNSVYKTIKNVLTDNKLYSRMSRSSNPYGDGHSSEKIIKIIQSLGK